MAQNPEQPTLATVGEISARESNAAKGVSLGAVGVAFIAIRWAGQLADAWGWDLQHTGQIAARVGLMLGLGVSPFLIDLALARVWKHRPIRSGLWLAALMGPWVGLVTYVGWEAPILSQGLGGLAAVAAFGLGYWVEGLGIVEKWRGIAGAQEDDRH